MRGIAALVSLLMFVFGASAVDAQTSAGEDRHVPGPVSVHAEVGGTLPHADESGGNLQALSIGYSPTPKLTVLVGVNRMHRPTSLRRYSDGVTSLTRGGTVQYASGEVRFNFRSSERVAPYAFTGGGLGVSRPNVNEDFPNRVTNAAYVYFGGGGLAVPLGSRLRVTGDFGFFVLGERDTIRLILPVRAGLAWHF